METKVEQLGSAVGVERFRVVVDGEAHELTVEQGENGLLVNANGKDWAADLQQFSGTNLVSLILAGKSLEFLVDRDGDRFFVTRGTDRYDVTVRPAWASSQDEGLKAGANLEVAIESPIVGVLVDVQVTVGQEVNKGDLLLVIEAMKMQNEIRAPRDGVVKQLKAGQGDKVAMRQPLLVLS